MGLISDYVKRGWQEEDQLKRQQQAQSLIGAPSRQIDAGQPIQQVQDVDPATGEKYTYEKSVLPTSQAGTGYLGAMEGLLSPQQQAQAELYGGLLSTPGQEKIGAQGLQGLLSRQQATQFKKDDDALARHKADAIASAKAIGDTFKKEQDIRGEFRKETNTFVDINDAYGRIQASAKEPSAAGDLSMIFNYMKMLDPGSVVRESEFATAANSASVPERVRGVYNKILTGERLTPIQRGDFTNRAGMLYNEALGGFNQRKKVFEGLASSYGVDPEKATYTRSLYEQYVKPKGLVTTEESKIPPLPAGFVVDK
jgi:hypothetical protein